MYKEYNNQRETEHCILFLEIPPKADTLKSPPSLCALRARGDKRSNIKYFFIVHRFKLVVDFFSSASILFFLSESTVLFKKVKFCII